VIDAESLVQQWLTDQLAPVARVCTETPDKMETVVPVVRVERLAGRGRFNLDLAVIDIDVFHLDRDKSRKYAEIVRDLLMLTLPGSTVGDGFVTGIENTQAPSLRPWENTNLRRFGATYEVWVKPTYA
jgi:hypothetical protein